MSNNGGVMCPCFDETVDLSVRGELGNRGLSSVLRTLGSCLGTFCLQGATEPPNRVSEEVQEEDLSS